MCLVIGVVVSFISVPLTMGYSHPGLYGVWVTIGALLAWLQLANFGLGNRLGNRLSNALATGYGNYRPDLASITSQPRWRYSLAILTGVTLLIGGACALAWPKID